MLTTYAECEQALKDAEHDVATDFGEDMVDQAWGDLVEAICTMVTDESLAATFIQAKLGYVPTWASPGVKRRLEEALGW